MKFAEPIWLLAGLIACGALVWAWRRYDARQRAALAAFASSHLHAQLTASFSAAKRHWKRGLLLAAVGCLFLALARPQAGFRWEEVKRRGIEVVFAVDTSRSMLTPDVKPDRLTRAKLAVDDFVSHLNGDGVGLIAFAGNAFLQCPITLDYDAFHESLEALDTTIIPRGGTDIASAIREAQAALQSRPGKDKILILLTDGEDLEGSALATANAAAKDGLKICTVGVGTANGDLIPIPAEQCGGTLCCNPRRPCSEQCCACRSITHRPRPRPPKRLTRRATLPRLNASMLRPRNSTRRHPICNSTSARRLTRRGSSRRPPRRFRNRSMANRPPTPSGWLRKRTPITTSAIRFIAAARRPSRATRSKPSRPGNRRLKRMTPPCNSAPTTPTPNTTATSCSENWTN